MVVGSMEFTGACLYSYQNAFIFINNHTRDTVFLQTFRYATGATTTVSATEYYYPQYIFCNGMPDDREARRRGLCWMVAPA